MFISGNGSVAVQVNKTFINRVLLSGWITLASFEAWGSLHSFSLFNNRYNAGCLVHNVHSWNTQWLIESKARKPIDVHSLPKCKQNAEEKAL